MRTEKEVLKDFKNLLGYTQLIYDGEKVIFQRKTTNFLEDEYATICIEKNVRFYKAYWVIPSQQKRLVMPITMQEHKLLTELFTIWGWLL